MARTIAIGVQDFGKLIKNNYFYVDKTLFIKEWWENGDDVTLITRPRRFGKTLAMDMVNCFFSINHKEDACLFTGLNIWKEESYRKLQGSYPVIYLSFANIKANNYDSAREMICQLISETYDTYAFLLEKGNLTSNEKSAFQRKSVGMSDVDLKNALHQLSRYLNKYYGKKVIILLDEYDAPMQEAYLNNYWDEWAELTRGMFHAAFKTNPCLEKAILTGVTRISKESVFSDLNNLEVVTTTSEKYESAFGFTEEEVYLALEEFNLQFKIDDVRRWYDGFRFGNCKSIYNPWSITQFLDKKKFAPYWANTSSNSLVNHLVTNGKCEVKKAMEGLLQNECFRTYLDEEVVFDRLTRSKGAVWSFLVAGGYLKFTDFQIDEKEEIEYALAVTNFEVMKMFKQMIVDWFYEEDCDIGRFCDALCKGDLNTMQKSLERDLIHIFSFFDTADENSYHMFILGLIACLQHKYVIKSNIEAGFGRCDTVLYPKDNSQDGIILEYKKIGGDGGTLEGIAAVALKQIIDKKYFSDFEILGVSEEHIRVYGFAFKGKEVLIEGGYLTEVKNCHNKCGKEGKTV